MTPAQTPPPSKEILRGILITGFLFWLGLTAVAALLGFFIQSNKGLWGGLLGGVIAGAFFFVTAAVAIFTDGKSVNVIGPAILGSWLLKIIILIGALAWLKSQTFYSKEILFGTLIITTFGMLILEAKLMTNAPITYVEPEEPA